MNALREIVRRHEKEFLLLGLYGLWLVSYLGAPHLRLSAPHVLAWDPVWRVPVVPFFIVPYQSAYFMPFVILAASKDILFLRRFSAAMAAAICVSMIGFITVSLTLPFPEVSHATLFGTLLNWQRNTDTTGNFFPSLHVSMSMLMALAAGRMRPGWRVFMLAWASLIAASTLFTHMHYGIDVIGGLTVAAAAWWLFIRRPKIEALTTVPSAGKVSRLL